MKIIITWVVAGGDRNWAEDSYSVQAVVKRQLASFKMISPDGE